jgi:hypothetical protein
MACFAHIHPGMWKPMKRELVAELKTVVRCEDPNGTYSHFAKLVRDNRGVILVIDGTPGQWYVKDIPARGELFIDFGARWGTTNLQEVMAEVREILKGGK